MFNMGTNEGSRFTLYGLSVAKRYFVRIDSIYMIGFLDCSNNFFVFCSSLLPFLAAMQDSEWIRTYC